MAMDCLVNVALVVPDTEAEGPGRRFAVWVQGCPFRCPGCCNPEMLVDSPKVPTPTADLVRAVLTARDTHGVEGVSFLGGEPFAQAEALAVVAEGVRAGGLSVMVFSGFTLAELRGRTDPGAARLLAATDVLVDGRFEAALRTSARRWVGSDNQVMHFLTDRYAPTDPRFTGDNHLEIRLRGGVLTINGWPVRGARTGVVRP